MRRRRLLALLAAGSIAGCLGDDEAPAEPDPGDWFAGVAHYDGFVDRTDDAEVTVAVGAGEHGFRFDPPAITVAPDTSVTFEWVDDTNAHNVEAEDGDWQNPGGLVDEVGHTWTRTFTEPGTHTYKCWPHAGQGMKGAVFVDAGA
ncbi:MAG: halocyanin domain-containing protein [Halobacteriales archaeon]